MSDKRAEILEAATKAAQQSGLKSVSFRHLADEVGVKSSSVHYHFPTKPDLAESMVLSYTEQFEVRLLDIANREKTLLGKLNAMTKIFEDVLAGKDMCLCGMMAAELDALNPSTRQALKKFFDVAESWLVTAIEEHQADIRISISPQTLGKVILSGLEGAILLDRVEESGERLDALKEMAEAIVS